MGVCASSDAQVGDTSDDPNTPLQHPSPPPESPSGSQTASSPGPSSSSGFKVFAGTFNINGSPLSSVDVESWLASHGASSCDLICLAFQECATCSWSSDVLSDLVNMGGREQIGMNERNDNEFINTILNSLDSRFEIIGDKAIGEPPTSRKVEIEGVKTEWYGFIRLVVLRAVASQVDVGRIIPFEVRNRVSIFSAHSSCLRCCGLPPPPPPYPSPHLPHTHPILPYPGLLPSALAVQNCPCSLPTITPLTLPPIRVP